MDIRKTEHSLLISICVLIVIPLLYVCRSFDANALTSWRWVFSAGGILPVFFLLFPSVIVAYFLSRLPFPGRHASLLLFFLSFFSVVPLWSEPEMIIDASRYFIQAKSAAEYGIGYFVREWGRGIPAWTDLPLVPFLYGLVFSLIGEARIYIQTVNSILFAGSVLLTCLIGEKLWDAETGLLAGLLLLGIPYLLVQVPLMLVDVPSMFFLTLAVYAFLRVVESGGLFRIAAAALALVLALFSKYSTWPMLLIIPVISAVHLRSDPGKIMIRTSAVLLLTGMIGAFVITCAGDFFHEQIMLLKTYQLPGLKRWEEGWISTFFFQTHPFLTSLSVYGISRALREKDRRFLIAGCFFFLVVLLDIKRIRYMIPLFPLFVLAASYGLNQIKDAGGRKFIALSIVASSLVIAYAAYLPFLNRTSMANLKHAGEYLERLDHSSVLVYALPQRSSSGSTFAIIPVLDYYTRKKIISLQQWPGHPAAGNTRTSSMRFTWEIKKPPFYSERVLGDGQAVAVISDRAVQELPHPLSDRELQRFDLADEVFKYQTAVTLFERNHPERAKPTTTRLSQTGLLSQ